MALAPLNRTILNVLVAFHEAGGVGTLDMHGRVLCGAPPGPLPADTTAWMAMVSRGFIAGEGGMILETEEGRIEAERLIAARTKVGA